MEFVGLVGFVGFRIVRFGVYRAEDLEGLRLKVFKV